MSLSETQAQSGDTQAAAELRSKLREQNILLEEREAELARVQSRMTSQLSLLEFTKSEHESMMVEMKRMLATKDEMAATRDEEAEKAIRGLEAKMRTIKDQADRQALDADDELSKLKLQLRQKEVAFQAEASHHEQVRRGFLKGWGGGGACECE